MRLGGQDGAFRAPAEDGGVLVAPSWRETLNAAKSPFNAADLHARELCGQRLGDFRLTAREEALQAAAAYTLQYVDVDLVVDSSAPLVLTGHQPELVHPGVWLKNFAASQLATDCGGVALNLIIDVDLCRSTSIAVPSGTVDSPKSTRVRFDVPGDALPWEEHRIRDATTWNSFAQRSSDAIAPLVRNPLVDQWWPDVIDRGVATGVRGAAIAQARHRTEVEWNRPSLQLPQSAMCQSTAFRRFVGYVLASLPSFYDVYNASLDEYRRHRKIRNAAQPAPNLTRQDEWLETPFWIWSTSNPVRRPLFAKLGGEEIQLTDRADFSGALPASSSEWFDAGERLAEWEQAGVKIRSRALLTTLYARFALGDVFIHGIGGSKYDHVTDEIWRRFFAFEPPAYCTLSGTLRLPIPHESGHREDLTLIRQQLRELQFHPERHLVALDGNAAQLSKAASLVETKTRWIKTPKTSDNAATRHQAIASANAGLNEILSSERLRLERCLTEAKRRVHANVVLESREYAFCLFPQELLKKFLLDFSTTFS